MDKLDKLSAWAIAALLVSVILVIALQSDEVHSDQQPEEQQRAAVYLRPDQLNRIEVARSLLAQNSLEQSAGLLRTLAEELPYEGQVHMLLGELHMRKQDSIAAMLAYRTAIDLHPDFLDKKAPDFQGKQVKVAVQEASVEIGRRLQQNQGDSELKEIRRTLYYMLRRIAGSCG